MKIYQYSIIAVVLLGIMGCDPAYIKKVSVDVQKSQENIETLLPAIDATAKNHGFFRSRVSANAEAAVTLGGGRLIAWYDRDEIVTLNRGSFIYLAILQDTVNKAVILKLHAFPATGEPNHLRNFRVEITNILCSNGFHVEGACGV